MSARLTPSHGSGSATTASLPAGVSPACRTVRATSSQPGAVKVSVVLRSVPPALEVTVMWNEVEVRPDVRSGVHHAVPSLCVSDHDPASVFSSISSLPPPVSNSSAEGVTESRPPSWPEVESLLHETAAAKSSVSSR